MHPIKTAAFALLAASGILAQYESSNYARDLDYEDHIDLLPRSAYPEDHHLDIQARDFDYDDLDLHTRSDSDFSDHLYALSRRTKGDHPRPARHNPPPGTWRQGSSRGGAMTGTHPLPQGSAHGVTNAQLAQGRANLKPTPPHNGANALAQGRNAFVAQAQNQLTGGSGPGSRPLPPTPLGRRWVEELLEDEW